MDNEAIVGRGRVQRLRLLWRRWRCGCSAGLVLTRGLERRRRRGEEAVGEISPMRGQRRRAAVMLLPMQGLMAARRLALLLGGRVYRIMDELGDTVQTGVHGIRYGAELQYLSC